MKVTKSKRARSTRRQRTQPRQPTLARQSPDVPFPLLFFLFLNSLFETRRARLSAIVVRAKSHIGPIKQHIPLPPTIITFDVDVYVEIDRQLIDGAALGPSLSGGGHRLAEP